MINVGDYIAFDHPDESTDASLFEITGVSYGIPNGTICIFYRGYTDIKTFIFEYEGQIEYLKKLNVNGEHIYFVKRNT